jgi:hypothetical protein
MARQHGDLEAPAAMAGGSASAALASGIVGRFIIWAIRHNAR